MEIRISNKDRLRVNTNDGRIFADISSTPQEESLTIEFYSFAKQIIIEKNGTFKLFIFNKQQELTDYDFGFWKDGKVVWQSV
jgi:hypothetical protein